MKVSLRMIFSAVAGAMITLVVGLAVFTAELVADEVGYAATVRRFVREGWSAMVSAGYADWIFLGAIFFSGGAVALWIDYVFRRNSSPPIQTVTKITETVVGKHFRNQQVILDGKRYQKCEFENVTFVYNGGQYDFSYNTVRGCHFRTDVPEIEAFVFILGEFGFLSVPTMTDQGAVEFKGFKKNQGDPAQ